MELSKQSQITDHSSEHIESEDVELCDHPEDDLTAILKAKDEMIRTLQLGNLCFKQKADGLEKRFSGVRDAMESALSLVSAIVRILEVVPLNDLSAQESNGVYLVIKYLAEEAEGGIEHDFAMGHIPNIVNRSTDSEG